MTQYYVSPSSLLTHFFAVSIVVVDRHPGIGYSVVAEQVYATALA
jgi:hypothetical protein